MEQNIDELMELLKSFFPPLDCDSITRPQLGEAKYGNDIPLCPVKLLQCARCYQAVGCSDTFTTVVFLSELAHDESELVKSVDHRMFSQPRTRSFEPLRSASLRWPGSGKHNRKRGNANGQRKRNTLTQTKVTFWNI